MVLAFQGPESNRLISWYILSTDAVISCGMVDSHLSVK